MVTMVMLQQFIQGFVKTDKEFQNKGQTSGTTATFVIVDRWMVTASGGEVGRLSIMGGGAEIGPLRCSYSYRTSRNANYSIFRFGIPKPQHINVQGLITG